MGDSLSYLDNLLMQARFQASFSPASVEKGFSYPWPSKVFNLIRRVGVSTGSDGGFALTFAGSKVTILDYVIQLTC